MYDAAFYDYIRNGAFRSAHKIIPSIMDIFHPHSVIDYGCGTGSWLLAFKQLGVEEVLGIDGDYVDQSMVPIPFQAADLSLPFLPEHRYDLAISLEVAEHLPSQAADIFVETLCDSSDHIVFSAAIPGQGGVGHYNEQWPSYWVPKFESRGYICSSNFRYDFWQDEDVENWYRQNILLFTKDFSCMSTDTAFKYFLSTPGIIDVVHYNNWLGKI